MGYFKEVEFELPEDPGERPQTKENKLLFDEEKLEGAVKAIKEEFVRFKDGTSDFTSYAINPGSFGFPAANRLSIFLKDPTQKNYLAFLEIAKQDFGARAATHFMDLLKEAKNV